MCNIFVGQPDGVKQVLDIFTTDDVDFGVKKSAADQLAIMLQGTANPQFFFKLRKNLKTMNFDDLRP